MRWRIATLLLSITVLALVVGFGRDVSVPMPHQQQTDGHVSAHIPWLYSDSSGVSIVCVSSASAVLYPPIFHVVPATLAPVVPIAASNQSNPPPAAWGGP